MKQAVMERTKLQKKCFAEDVRDQLIKAGYEDLADDIINAAGPGFALESVAWLEAAVHSIIDCGSHSDANDAIYVLLGNINGGDYRFDQKRATRILKVFGFHAPTADNESAFFRILAGARAAIRVTPSCRFH